MIKFIADVNLEKPVIDFLRENGYDVLWVPDYNCEISDKDLLVLANTQNRVLLTNDKDFGEITFLQKKLSAGIILFRVKEQNAQDKIILIKKLLQNYGEKIVNHFIVINKDRIRFVPMEGII